MQCTVERSTGATETIKSLEVDYKRIMYSLVNSLNRIALHGEKPCAECERKRLNHKGWILDSGASVHFTNEISDFIDYEEVKDAPKVTTAAKSAPLQIIGKGAILLSHYVEKNGHRESKLTRIYPVHYIPGLSTKLLSMGTFLQNAQEV